MDFRFNSFKKWYYPFSCSTCSFRNTTYGSPSETPCGNFLKIDIISKRSDVDLMYSDGDQVASLWKDLTFIDVSEISFLFLLDSIFFSSWDSKRACFLSIYVIDIKRVIYCLKDDQNNSDIKIWKEKIFSWTILQTQLTYYRYFVWTNCPSTKEWKLWILTDLVLGLGFNKFSCSWAFLLTFLKYFKNL